MNKARTYLQTFTKGDVRFWAFAASVVLTSVVACKHATYAEALAPGQSGIGEGILISYTLAWPGVAVFMMLLADGMYDERHFSKHLFARSVLGGILPVLVNYGFVLLVSKLTYPWNSYAALTAMPTAVLIPVGVFVLAVSGGWPFSLLNQRPHERKRSA